MNIDTIITDLEEIVSSPSDLTAIPYVKGNSIRIKNYAIRKSKNVYIIFDCKENKKITEVNFKLSAIAVAKTLSENKNYVKQINLLDNKMLKHYNDIHFYKYIIKSSNSKCTKDLRKIRLEISMQTLSVLRNQIEKFVFVDKY